MALCVLWILANILLFNALHVYGSLPIPVLIFEEKIIEDDETSITCMLPCDCPNAEITIKGNVTLNNCIPKRGNYPNVTCTIDVTKEMHEMEFTCEAQFKTQSLPKKLHILTEPEFTDCANDLVWVEGQETSFLCKATGYPPPTVICEKNNITYMDGQKFTAMRNMSGNFTCKATNFDTVKKIVKVTVEYKPKILSVTVNPPLRAEGDKVEINCEANGLPNPDYTWNTPSTDIQLSPNKQVITIASLKESHLGNYSCRVQNNHGTDHMEATLDFATKPKILRFLIEPSTQVLAGDNVTLICEASGFPTPELIWSGPNMDTPRGKQSFTILGVKQTHVGSYTCTAKNKHGSDTATQQLSLAVKPKISQIQVNPSNSVTEGTDVTLTCDAEGDPSPNYSWKTPKPQPNSNTSVLHIRNTKKDDEGDYECTVANKFGRDIRTTKLLVLTVPEPTQGNRGDRPQSVIATILATMIFLFFHLC